VGQSDRVAVLVDCDNTSWRLGEAVLAEAATHGTLSIKRGYGDWSSEYLSGWKGQLAAHAVQPVQQTAYVSGKNATDAALIIDAMDLLYSGNVDAFVLVSSDSDFTRLAMRLRESGRRVYGIGAQKTHVSFQNACDRFTFTEVLRRQDRDGAPATVRAPAEERLDTTRVPDVVEVLVPAITATMRDDGWAPLSTVGTYVVNNHPTFDARNYGFAKLGMLVRSLAAVEVKSVPAAGGGEQPWVRVAPRRPAAAASSRVQAGQRSGA
jgi:hypothetical protein